ncbi:MAG: serine--tRNA ligase, partial [Acidobacteriota bacterium]
MLARELWRNQTDRVRGALAARRSDAPLSDLLVADASWREAQAELEALNGERNRGSKEVGKLFAAGQRERGETLRARMAALG